MSGGDDISKWNRFCRNLNRNAHCRLFGLMHNLLYPAFLGTFMFSTLSSCFDTESPMAWGSARSSMALWLLLFFALGYTESMLSEKFYSIGVFLVDVLEIALMSTLFYELQFEETLFPKPEPVFWFLMSALLILPCAARFIPPSYASWPYDFLCAVSVVICSMGVSIADVENYLPAAVVRGLWIVMLLYVIVLVFDFGTNASGTCDEDEDRYRFGFVVEYSKSPAAFKVQAWILWSTLVILMVCNLTVLI